VRRPGVSTSRSASGSLPGRSSAFVPVEALHEPYAGRFGFMGVFIVRPEHRRQGLGRQRWHARRDRVIARLRPLSPSRSRGAMPGGHEGVWICRQREIAEQWVRRFGSQAQADRSLKWA
jgi:hypothetical protein